ncbi:Putative glycosyl transferase [Rubrivivax sp. A210]|uniref:glycosyl transferase n=1 Tax=Rubrivivax sp. A210 TaxID=2772301 RepID=UPI00191ACB08|nr:glycosyl transferase [Rubrivivax sp. A210]CAD5366288.1 Putative glycosyl transferase [Rubrivivax sp. A210]
MAAGRPQRYLCLCLNPLGGQALACVMRVVEELLPHADVDLVHGGGDASDPPSRPRLRSLHLADPWPAMDGQAVARFLRPPYGAVLVEGHPFGDGRLARAIQALLQAANAGGVAPHLFSTVDDTVAPLPLVRQRQVVEAVHRQIHTVLVRGDPEVVGLSESFALATAMGERLCYTGYTVAPPPTARPLRRRQVLVSLDGSQHGRVLLQAATAAAALMPGHDFLLAGSAAARGEEMTALRESAHSPNVRVLSHPAQRLHLLAECELSIHAGGGDILVEQHAVRTPGLAWPDPGQAREALRIAGFARKGLVGELAPADLAPVRLKARIEAALRAPYPSARIAMHGAREAAERMRAVVDGHLA